MFWLSPYFNIFLSGGEIGKRNTAKANKHKNNAVWLNVFSQLLTDALDRYHFEGLPDTISERVLLQSLLWYGSACIFEKDGGIMALPCVPSGAGFNVYGDPAEGWLFSNIGQLNEKVDLYLPGSEENAFLLKTNGYKGKANLKGVFIRENAVCYPFIRQTMFYSEAIADSIRTLDVCRQNIKRPFVIVAEESIVPTVKDFFKKRDENFEYIVSSGIFPADKIKLLPFETNTEAINQTTGLIDWYFNKYKELCGVDNNSNIDKKGENLITSEISINEEYTDAGVDKCLEYIEKGLEDANKIFGLNIKVERNHEKKNLAEIDNDERGLSNEEKNAESDN